MSINNLDNPFIVSKQIPDELFCDRKEETATLIKQIANGKDVVLVSPRRMGKTGLIHHLFRQPVANDDVYRTFAAYQAGVLTKEETLARLKIKQLYNQLTFKSEQSLSYLKFATAYTL